MLNGLKLINLPPSASLDLALCNIDHVNNVFILKTCQRTLLLGFNQGPELLLRKLRKLSIKKGPLSFESHETYGGPQAYEFLLETICGLKSRILGENEIVHQFKEAYSQFLSSPRPNRHVQNVLEKLFKDAKGIRTKHLREIGLQTYAGIVRKILTNRLAGSDYQTPILILGSGQLAQDIIKICYRKFNLTISARNTEKVNELKSKYPLKSLNWFNPQEMAHFPLIINTIGTQDILFDQDFFQKWQSLSPLNSPPKLFVCLGRPSPLQSSLTLKQGLWRLNDIFEQGEKLSQKREEKLKEAQKAIYGVSQKRKKTFTVQMPFGWEELQFA